MSGNLILESAPHDLSVSTTGKVMRTLILTLIPALIATTWFYGFGTLITTLITIVSCVGSEALWLKLRKRRIAPVWRDCSALTTAVLLGLTLPPLLPWYLSVIVRPQYDTLQPHAALPDSTACQSSVCAEIS